MISKSIMMFNRNKYLFALCSLNKLIRFHFQMKIMFSKMMLFCLPHVRRGIAGRLRRRHRKRLDIIGHIRCSARRTVSVQYPLNTENS